MVEHSIERLREVFRYDPGTGAFYWKVSVNKPRCKMDQQVGYIDAHGYLILTIDRQKIKAHRAAWAIYYGEWPTLPIDHINGVKTDNRVANLRMADKSQNAANSHWGFPNGSRGVTLLPNGKWQSQITVRGKTQYLGSFPTKDEAAKAYADASREAFGEFSVFSRAA